MSEKDRERSKTLPEADIKSGPVRKTSAPPVDAEDIEHEKPLEWGLFLRSMGFLRPYKLQMAVNVVIAL